MKNNKIFIEEFNKGEAQRRKIANALYYIEKRHNEADGYKYGAKAIQWNDKKQRLFY